MLEAAYIGWPADVAAGRTSALIAATGTDVTALKAKPRRERVGQGYA